MFRREIELAVGCGERMRTCLEAAAAAPRIHDVTWYLRNALEAAWRMESALGEFLAVEDPKLEATGFTASHAAARRAFDALKPALADADLARRTSEAEMKAWLERFRPCADESVAAARQALAQAPANASHRISTAIGPAPPDQARSVVSIARTDERHLGVDAVEDLVRQALAPLGAIERFVRAGQTVLLKPNQTLFVLSDEGSTTDPRVVAALTRLCYGAGARNVIVGESAGGGSNTDRVMEITGVKLLAQRAGAEVIDFQTSAQREVDLPKGKYVKRIMLPVPLLEADVVINLPKMKTHHWDWISGALKNWVGVVRPDVREQHHDVHTFDEYVDLLARVPAQLHIMDAVVRGVGNGPGANVGECYGAILASSDPVALDAVAAQILGFDPSAIGFVRVAAQRGLGIGDPRQIAVVGVPLDQAIRPALPPTMGVDMFDANVIVGAGLTRAGTLGHFKSMADIFQAMGTWDLIRRLRGRPTVLIGDAEDPLFSDHLKEGPYVVIDDAAPARYKYHPDVYFIPGHPVLHNLESELLIGLRIPTLGRIAFDAMGKVRLIEMRLELRAPQPLVPMVRAAISAGRRLPIPAQVALTFGAAGSLLVASGLALWKLAATRSVRRPPEPVDLDQTQRPGESR